MADIPDWLQEALERVPAPAAPITGPVFVGNPTPAVGDLIPVVGMDMTEEPARLALVVRVDPRAATATIILATPETDLATDTDVEVPRETTGLPYDILIQTDLIGPVFWSQLASPIANIGDDLALGIARGRADGFADLRFQRGLPIQDDDDLRYAFKRAEIAALRRLTAACGSELVDPPPADVDPDALAAAILGAEEALCAALLSEPAQPLPLDLIEDVVNAPLINHDFERVFLDLLETSVAFGGLSEHVDAQWWPARPGGRLGRLAATRLAQGRATMRVRSHRPGDENVLVVGRTHHSWIQVVFEEAVER